MAEVFRWDVSSWDDGGVWGPAGDHPAYSLRVDLDRDGTFAPDNALAELTLHCRALRLRHGMDDGFGEIAPPAELEAVLANPDGDFLPARAAAAYYGLLKPGLLVRFQATYAGTTYTLWLGRLKSLEIAPGGYSAPRDVLLRASDKLLDLQAGEYSPALQTGVTADEALTALFNADLEAVRWPYDGAPASVASYTSFETGRTVQAWVGDNAETIDQRGIMPRQHIEDVVVPEGGGRFFWDAPSGKWTFHNREHDLLAPETDTFDGDEFIPELSSYLYSDRIINKVSYDFVPRAVGAPGSVIYEYPSLPVFIPKSSAGGTMAFTARYTDPDQPGARVGAIDTIAPVAYTDYEVMGGGINLPQPDRTLQVTPTVTFYADRADVVLVSSENSKTKLLAFQLRGTPLYTYDRMTLSEQDATSIALYGIHELPPTLLLSVDTETFARALAQWVIALYAEPFDRFARVTFQAHESDALALHALTRQVGDKLRITNARLGHDRAYVIAGVERDIDAQTQSHLCAWTLKPLPVDTYGLMDVHNFDDDVRLFL